MSNWKRSGKLFLIFLKIGAFTFGGGYAMIPMIQRETVEKAGWIKEEDILDIMAISESTPGPIAVNAATFVGYQVGGLFGAFCATFGVILPSFCIILGLSLCLRQFESLKVVRYAFLGIRAGMLALVVRALLSMARQCPRNLFSWLLAAAAFVAVAVFDISVLLVIVCCALIGLSASLLARKGGGRT